MAAALRQMPLPSVAVLVHRMTTDCASNQNELSFIGEHEESMAAIKNQQQK